MSLIVYTKKEDVPDEIKIIKDNDLYFNAFTFFTGSDLESLILNEVDVAKVLSDKTFMGRSDCFGPLDRMYISSGSKTLLNVLSCPDICFDCTECGSNALGLLSKFRDGCVFLPWRYIYFTGEGRCDIVCNGRHFVDFYDFINYNYSL